MSDRMRRLPRWAGAALVAVSLGFGAAQAAAEPRVAVPSAGARVCDPDECASWCDSIGGVGQCVGAVCRCIIG
jgi:hypothetical protein